MSTPDTLCCDTAQIHAWQSDAAFDYQREFVNSQPNLWQWILMQVRDFLSSLFGSDTASAITRSVLIVSGLILLALVVWFVYKTRPELFHRNRKLAFDDGEEETIYGVDFDAVIRQAITDSDYRLAVRYVYLQTLRHLSDHALIDWMPHKTPTQYVLEYDKDDFRGLTNLFLRVRYGNFEATPPIYERACSLQSSIIHKEESL